MTDREKLIELLETVPAHQRLYPDLYVDYLIENGVTIQKRGKWIVNHESYDGYKHHMCSYCKQDAIFNYIYVADYDEMLDGEWDYIGQREDGIDECLTDCCPHCGAVMGKK